MLLLEIFEEKPDNVSNLTKYYTSATMYTQNLHLLKIKQII